MFLIFSITLKRCDVGYLQRLQHVLFLRSSCDNCEHPGLWFLCYWAFNKVALLNQLRYPCPGQQPTLKILGGCPIFSGNFYTTRWRLALLLEGITPEGFDHWVLDSAPKQIYVRSNLVHIESIWLSIYDIENIDSIIYNTGNIRLYNIDWDTYDSLLYTETKECLLPNWHNLLFSKWKFYNLLQFSPVWQLNLKLSHGYLYSRDFTCIPSFLFSLKLSLLLCGVYHLLLTGLVYKVMRRDAKEQV